MSKTPYEVRLDVLAMAQQIVAREHDVKVEAWRSQVEAKQRILATSTMPDSAVSNITDSFAVTAPLSYTANEVVAKASELYSFVMDTSGATRSAKSGSPDRGKTSSSD